ncbi:hypothetical protein ACEQ8H_004414 [Pleosporales sp. CAS-2024a]
MALFRDIYAGRDTGIETWKKFQLVEGEYEHLERTLLHDIELWGFVDDKIRYDYDAQSHNLYVRPCTTLHQRFLAHIENAIRAQLQEIQSGSGKASDFARKIHATRSTQISYHAAHPPTQSKHKPDASFTHDEALFPGVVFQIAYPHHRPHLRRLAAEYILHSNAAIQAVVTLCVPEHVPPSFTTTTTSYSSSSSISSSSNRNRNGKAAVVNGTPGKRATLSICRADFTTVNNKERKLRALEDNVDVAFRDNNGKPINLPGLQLRLSQFSYEALAWHQMGNEDCWIRISGTRLCEYLRAAEDSLPRSYERRKRYQHIA